MIDGKTVEQARNTDIIAFFERRCGFTFAHRGGAYRCQQHQSLAVKNDRRSWYWHSKGIGGHGALDYLMKVENVPFREAVEAAAGIALATVQPRQEAEQPKTLVLPAKKEISLRLYDYLCRKRGIDSEVVNALIQEEKLYEDRRGNVVFVGHDEHGKHFKDKKSHYVDESEWTIIENTHEPIIDQATFDNVQRLRGGIVQMRLDGHTMLEIAEKHGITKQRVNQILQQAGVKTRFSVATEDTAPDEVKGA